MKTSFKTVICAFALSTLFVFNASANDKGTKKVAGFGSSIFASKDNKILVNVDKYNKAATAILLEDANGNIVYREIMGSNETKFRRVLDVSQLPIGDYTVRVLSKGEKVTKKFELSEKVAKRLVTVEEGSL